MELPTIWWRTNPNKAQCRLHLIDCVPYLLLCMPFNWYHSKVNPLSFLPKRRDLLAGVRLRVRADFVQLLVFPNDLAESSVFAGPQLLWLCSSGFINYILPSFKWSNSLLFAPSKRRQWHILLLQAEALLLRFLDSSHPPFANASVHRWWPKRGAPSWLTLQ